MFTKRRGGVGDELWSTICHTQYGTINNTAYYIKSGALYLALGHERNRNCSTVDRAAGDFWI